MPKTKSVYMNFLQHSGKMFAPNLKTCLQCGHRNTNRIPNMKTKQMRRQLSRTAGGQDLWPRKSEAHSLHTAGGTHGWHKEFIKRGLGQQLAGPVGKLPS
jgi:hypothetical protein